MLGSDKAAAAGWGQDQVGCALSGLGLMMSPASAAHLVILPKGLDRRLELVQPRGALQHVPGAKPGSMPVPSGCVASNKSGGTVLHSVGNLAHAHTPAACSRQTAQTAVCDRTCLDYFFRSFDQHCERITTQLPPTGLRKCRWAWPCPCPGAGLGRRHRPPARVMNAEIIEDSAHNIRQDNGGFEAGFARQ
jgi:hypothetical protein